MKTKWFDILLNGKPVYLIAACDEKQAIRVAYQIDKKTGKLNLGKVTASLRITPCNA
jgi:6-phosphogluconolactonase (cycloisomerase 2 family)